MSENNEIKEPLNKNYKVPKLRFKDFFNDWSSCKLLDIAESIKRKNDGKNWPLMMISASQGFINQSDRYDKDNAGTSKSKYTLIKYGELSYNHGNSKIKKYGAVFAMNNKGALIPFVYHTFSIRKPNNPFYFAKYLNLNIHNRYLKKVISSGARMDGLLNISLDDFFKMPINYPSLEEQNKINDFLEKIDTKINLINDKISILKKYKEGIMIKCYELAKNQVISLSKLVKNNIILLGRGEIIPKQNGTFPVYSSSAANNGLFCFRNKYSFDEELITWSIDGGGKPFLRNKHKFSITNVCGYATILDLNIFSYSWLYINFWNSWRKIKFDYTTKAHPSVIEKLYKIKSLDIESQMKIEKILTYINNKIDYLIKELNDVTLTKESLLRSLFF